MLVRTMTLPSALRLLFQSPTIHPTAPAVLKPGLPARFPHFHTAHQLRQPTKPTSTPQPSSPTSTSPQSSSPTPYANIPEWYPEYAKFNPDKKLAYITAVRAGIDASGARTKNPGYCEASLRDLEEEEKRVVAGDNVVYKMFRTIAWGPTILVNVFLGLFFS